jgi:hypothetical protein
MENDPTIRDAETSERMDAEVLDVLADENRAWLDNGGIDALAAHFGADTSDTDTLPY